MKGGAGSEEGYFLRYKLAKCSLWALFDDLIRYKETSLHLLIFPPQCTDAHCWCKRNQSATYQRFSSSTVWSPRFKLRSSDLVTSAKCLHPQRNPEIPQSSFFFLTFVNKLGNINIGWMLNDI